MDSTLSVGKPAAAIQLLATPSGYCARYARHLPHRHSCLLVEDQLLLVQLRIICIELHHYVQLSACDQITIFWHMPRLTLYM